MGGTQGSTNVGKKETRQADKLIEMAVREGELEEDGKARQVESRIVPDEHAADRGNK